MDGIHRLGDSYTCSASLTMSITTFVSLFLSAVLVRCFYLTFLHPLASYPGPWLAKLTYFWRFTTFLKGSQHLVDVNLHKRYGSVVRDGPDSLLISDIGAYKAIYGFNRYMEKGDFYLTQSNGKPENPNLFAARTEVLHREIRRKIVSPALSPKHITQYEDSLTKNTKAWLEKIEEESKSHGGRFNIAPSIERFTFDAMLEVAYGSSMGYTAAGYDQYGALAAKEAVWPITIGVSHVPWLAKFFSSNAIKSRIQKPRYDEQGKPKGFTAPSLWAVQQANAALQSTSELQPSILKNLLEVEDTDSRKLTPAQVRYECLNTIFAGTGSVAAALNALVYELGAHSDWQSRLYTEVRGADSLANAHLSNLPTLQAFMKESLRLHPPFAAPFERIIGPGGELSIPNLKGPLPVGTRVWCNQYVICRSPEVFGADAEEFRPERWLDSSPEFLKQMEDVYPVFGRGSRGCVGKDYAWMLLEKAVAAVVRNWIITSDPGSLQGRNAFEMQYRNLPISLVQRT